MSEFLNKVAVVTGGARGIGKFSWKSKGKFYFARLDRHRLYGI